MGRGSKSGYNKLWSNSTADSVGCEYGYQNLVFDINPYSNSHPKKIKRKYECEHIHRFHPCRTQKLEDVNILCGELECFSNRVLRLFYYELHIKITFVYVKIIDFIE